MVSLAGRRVLVTGGTGFVGGRLTERLILEERCEVRVLVRDWRKAVWVSRTTAELVEGDVLDRASLSRAVKDCDLVFHCASGPAVEGGYEKTNVEGTRGVVEACRAAGVKRMVYVSTVAVHGPSPAALDASPPYALMGRDYSDSKIRAEQMLFDEWQRNRFPMVVVRPTYVWGPRSNLFTLRQLREMKAGSFKYVDDGHGSCNAVYIDNLVDALILAAERDAAVGRGFLVTDGIEADWREFFGHYQAFLGIRTLPSISSRSRFTVLACRFLDHVEALLHRLQGSPAPLWRRVVRRLAYYSWRYLGRRYMSEWDLLKYARQGRADIACATDVLGYRPRFNLATGMAATLGWVRDQFGSELELTQDVW